MKKRKELREAITKSANGVKSNVYLEMILEVSEIFRMAVDDKEYTELTDLQWKQWSAIRNIISMESAENISRINTVISGMRRIEIGRA